MIGPHEGKELELMLSGQKKLALFHDALLEGQLIPEEIIPDQAFAPYVSRGDILRFQIDINIAGKNETIRYVLFSLPDEDWRAKTVLWMKRQTLIDHKPSHPHDDVIIGRLLGYKDNDIQDYVDRQKKK